MRRSADWLRLVKPQFDHFRPHANDFSILRFQHTHVREAISDRNHLFLELPPNGRLYPEIIELIRPDYVHKLSQRQPLQWIPQICDGLGCHVRIQLCAPKYLSLKPSNGRCPPAIWVLCNGCCAQGPPYHSLDEPKPPCDLSQASSRCYRFTNVGNREVPPAKIWLPGVEQATADRLHR